jgi:hypothetical protein
VYVGRPQDSGQTGTPHYTGHILLDGTTSITFNGSDDPLVHRFHSGPQKVIKDIGIEFLYMNNGVLTTYEVGNTEHVLKFEIKCSTDKLEGLTKVPLDKGEEKGESKESGKRDSVQPGSLYLHRHYCLLRYCIDVSYERGI